MENTTFVFIRHAESIKNLRDVTGGSGEELTPCGIEQTTAFSIKLSAQIDIHNCNVISSNVIQAEQTARIIANTLKTPVYVTEELRPAGMGIVSGLTKQEMKQKFPTMYEQLSSWRNREIEACALNIPGMEPPRAFWERILHYLKSICTGGIKIVVCTRSVLVLIYNYVHGNTPELGGGYKHINIQNCETIAFILDGNGVPLRIDENITSDGLK